MNGFRLFPDQASSAAPQIDLLYFGLVAITGLFVAIVALPILYFCIKYRRGSRADRSRPLSTSVSLELIWTAIPLAIALGIFVWGAVLYAHMQRAPAEALELHVIAKQWMWKIQHPQGRREIDELHVPLGRPVRLLLASQDVIHSFFIPAFRVKQDVVPGRYTSAWFTPTRLGTYHLFCAEYCGTDHSKMIGRVVVMRPEDYATWLASGDADPIAVTGGRLFRELGCSGCHAPGSAIRAPLLEGVFGRPVALAGGGMVRADEQYLRDSILMPAAQIVAGYENLMPSYDGQIDDAQLLQIVAYIKSSSDAERDLSPEAAHD